MLTTRPTILFLAVSLLLLQLADAYSIEQLWRRSSEDAIPERAARVKEREFSVEDILKRYAAAHPERFPGVDARDLSSEELTKRYADAHSKPAGEIQGRDNRRRDSRRRDNGRRAGKKILNFPDTNAGSRSKPVKASRTPAQSGTKSETT